MNYMKEERKRKIRSRKNFLPTLVATIIFWIINILIIYFFDPNNAAVIFAFFVSIFLSFLFTFSTVFANTRRGIIISTSLIIFLILRYFGIGNILNALLITGVAITTEIYFIKQG